MNKILVISTAMTLFAGCGAQELNQSLHDVTGQNINVIRSYPTGYTQSVDNNKVYMYSLAQRGVGCDIFFEVDQKNIIIKTSWKGEGCNSFYQSTLKP